MSRTTARLGCSLLMGAVGTAGCGLGGGWGAAPTGAHVDPVVGGEPAQPSDYPSTVALTNNVGQPFCSGTLVASKTVVTAAHCANAMSVNKMRVVYGSAHPAAEPPSAFLPVAQAVAHPDFDPNATGDADGLAQANDIGVIVLVDPIVGGKTTPILPLDQVDAVLYPYRDIYIAGFGVYELPDTSGELYKAITPHIRHAQWEMLAGKPGEPDTCTGDSGGPAYVVRGCELWLVGATSRMWAKATTPCGEGGIYTIVSNYVAFIEQTSGETLPVGTGSGGGLPVSVCEDGGADVQGDVLPDVDGACFPATSTCDPITNFGCDAIQGQVCTIDPTGSPVCHATPSPVGPGAPCDQSSRWCAAGYLCGASSRCEKVCCSASDCGSQGVCSHISSVLGTLGTCPLVEDAAIDDGAGGGAGDGGSEVGAGKAGASANAGQEGGGATGGGQTAELTVSGGCGCRIQQTPITGWVAATLALCAVAYGRLRRGRRAGGRDRPAARATSFL